MDMIRYFIRRRILDSRFPVCQWQEKIESAIAHWRWKSLLKINKNFQKYQSLILGPHVGNRASYTGT